MTRIIDSEANLPMLCRGKGILAIWHDLEPTGEAEFREWHTRQHMPERLSVPGFLRGCRYIAVTGSPKFFNFYQTQTPEILTSAPYLERLNDPTPWTARVVPYFRNINRSAGRVAASIGAGEGGVIATLRLSPRSDARDNLTSWLVDNGLQQVLERPGVAAVHLWNSDPSASLVDTAESRARVGTTAVADWTIAIDGNDVESVASASTWLEYQERFSSALEQPIALGIYQLQHRIGG